MSRRSEELSELVVDQAEERAEETTSRRRRRRYQPGDHNRQTGKAPARVEGFNPWLNRRAAARVVAREQARPEWMCPPWPTRGHPSLPKRPPGKGDT